MEEAHTLLTSSNIKLEPASETDSVHSSAGEIINEDQVFDQTHEQPASVKIECEQPDVYVDNPGKDVIQLCSQGCTTLPEQSEMEKKMVFTKIDWKLVKEEKPDVLCVNSYSDSMVGMTTSNSNSIQEMTERKTELRMHEDTTALVHHQEVSLVRTYNGYTASQQHENSRHMLENISTMTEMNSKLCLTNDNCQLHYVEIPVKHTHIPGTSFGYTVSYTSCRPQRIQSGDTPQLSDDCDAIINANTVSFLQRHKIDIQENPYKCDICVTYFFDAKMLKCHMRTHSGEKSYKFDICGASCSFFNSDMKRHMTLYTGVKPYKCVDCGASITTFDSLKCHMSTHTGEKPYKCDICGAFISRNSDLKRHTRTHTGVKPYKCNICVASFYKSDHLKNHMRTHTGEKPYKCDICGASFAHSGSLKSHMRTHMEEKLHKCDICGASFSKSGSLKCHMRTHTGEKPYKCDNCGASFTQSGGLKYHMKTHTEEKPHKCDICGESFTLSGSLKSHLRTHT